MRLNRLFPHTLGRAIVVVALALVSPSSFAVCTSDLYFGQFDPNCGDNFCSVQSPGSGTIQSVTGSFWGFGVGQPATSAGIDNGALSDDEWLNPTGSGFLIGGTWSQSPIDGCIDGAVAPGKSAEIMLATLGDEIPGTSLFALVFARRVPDAFPPFDFTFANGGGVARDITLVEIPRIRGIAASTPAGPYTIFGATTEQVAPGIYGDGSLLTDEAVKGYRVYMTAQLPAGLARSSAWTAVSTTVPLDGSVTLGIPPCPATGRYYLSQSIVFDSGFETDRVSPVRTIICDRCPEATLDKDGDGFLDRFGDPECCPYAPVCDCDDTNPSVHPFAQESCNAVDDDCNGFRDDISQLRLARDSSLTTLTWQPLLGMPHYDVVRGDLEVLRTTAGDYSQAARACVSNDASSAQTDDPADPPAGDGFWYLVRGNGCGGPGTYDEPGATPYGTRDSEIAASPSACP